MKELKKNVAFSYENFKLNQQIHSAEMCNSLKVLAFKPVNKLSIIFKPLQSACVALASVCALQWLLEVSDLRVMWGVALCSFIIGFSIQFMYTYHSESRDFNQNLKEFKENDFELLMGQKQILLAECIKFASADQLLALIRIMKLSVTEMVDHSKSTLQSE